MAITTRLTREMIDRYTAQGFWGTRTLNDYFAEALAGKADDLAVVDRDRRVTYRQLDGMVNALALALTGLGVGKGEVVAFQLPNWLETLALHLACKRMGAVSNPIIPIYRHREVEFILREGEVAVYVAPKTFRGFDFEEMMAGLAPRLPHLKQAVFVGGAQRPGNLTFDGLLDRGREGGTFSPPPMDANDVCLLLYTSGTTSDPKGVLHTHNTLLCENFNVAGCYNLKPGGVIFMPSPFTHIAGLLFGMEMPFLIKGSLVMMDIWDPNRAVEIISKERCSLTMGSTPFLQGILSSPALGRYDISCLEVFGCGGAPVPPELILKAHRLHRIDACRAYGSSEYSTVTLCRAKDPLDKKAYTDGAPAPGTEVRIVDLDTGEDAGPGGEGEILVRGPECFVGYRNADLNGEAFDARGWFYTGDIGRRDPDGYIEITGRKKDIIIRGGENISVKEVEDLLHAHPGVLQAAVVAMPDPLMGEKACAYVRLKPGAATLTFEEMTAYLEEKKIARQKLPERLELISEFPMTAAGKIKKFLLKRDIAGKLQGGS